MGMIYLDHAATGYPVAPGVAAAVENALRQPNGNPGRGGHQAALRSARIIMAARQAVAEFFGCSQPERLIFTSGCTQAINMAILGLPLAGGHVITTVLEHNAVLRPLWRLAKQQQITLTLLQPDADGLIQPQAVQQALLPNTRLVAMAHASNVTGRLQPVEQIGRVCRAAGLPLLVDAAQTAGHIPYMLDSQPIDMLAFCGHKGLMGPMGTGGLYVHPGVQLSAVLRGGTGVDSDQLDPPNLLPEAFESGTPNLPGIAGLQAAVAFSGKNMGARFERDMALVGQLYNGLAEIRGLVLPAKPQVPVLSAYAPGIPCGQIGGFLNDRGICVRTGLHCAPLIHHYLSTPGGTVRFSPGYGVGRADIRTAVQAMRAAVQAYGQPETGGTIVK